MIKRRVCSLLRRQSAAEAERPVTAPGVGEGRVVGGVETTSRPRVKNKWTQSQKDADARGSRYFSNLGRGGGRRLPDYPESKIRTAGCKRCEMAKRSEDTHGKGWGVLARGGTRGTAGCWRGEEGVGSVPVSWDPKERGWGRKRNVAASPNTPPRRSPPRGPSECQPFWSRPHWGKGGRGESPIQCPD